MLASPTSNPILPAHNPLLWWAMWGMAAATLAAVLLLVILAVNGTGWLVGYQLGRLKQQSR